MHFAGACVRTKVLGQIMIARNVPQCIETPGRALPVDNKIANLKQRQRAQGRLIKELANHLPAKPAGTAIGIDLKLAVTAEPGNETDKIAELLLGPRKAL